MHHAGHAIGKIDVRFVRMSCEKFAFPVHLCVQGVVETWCGTFLNLTGLYLFACPCAQFDFIHVPKPQDGSTTIMALWHTQAIM